MKGIILKNMMDPMEGSSGFFPVSEDEVSWKKASNTDNTLLDDGRSRWEEEFTAYSCKLPVKASKNPQKPN